MVVKGIVKEVQLENKRLVVRIPLFEPAGINKPILLTCPICYQPGNLDGYLVDDVVYIGFENNNFNNPIVLGKLYVGEDRASNYSHANSLKVESNATLPLNTTFGDISLVDVVNIFKKVSQLKEQWDDLKKYLNIDIVTSLPEVAVNGDLRVLNNGDTYTLYVYRKAEDEEGSWKELSSSGEGSQLYKHTISIQTDFDETGVATAPLYTLEVVNNVGTQYTSIVDVINLCKNKSFNFISGNNEGYASLFVSSTRFLATENIIGDKDYVSGSGTISDLISHISSISDVMEEL